jgi:hypothetical protein
MAKGGARSAIFDDGMENFVCKRCGHSNEFPDWGLPRSDSENASQCDRCFADAATGRRDIFGWLNMGGFFAIRLCVATMIVSILGTLSVFAIAPELLVTGPRWLMASIMVILIVVLTIVLWRRRVAK